MARDWKRTAMTVILSGVAVVGAFVVGLFVYMNAAMRPLHPDPNAVSSVTQPAPPPKWAAAVAQARQSARAALVARNLPGLSVAVGIDGEIVWAEGIGWADLEKRVPVAPHLRFRTGGISDALTSAAVGLLVEKDRLNLESEIQTYVREFPDKQWPITVRQVMGHVAGLRGDEGDEEPLQERCERTVDGLKRFAGTPLRSEPGTRFRYSSYGWILVSAAVEAAAKEPFFTFMRAQIFTPLNMRDTVPDSSTEPVPDRVAFYYPKFAADPRYGLDPAREGDYACFAGGGAFLSTPSDLVRFALAMNGGKLLRPATVKVLQTAQLLASGADSGYALGWDIETVQLGGRSTQMVGHDSEFTIGGSASLMTFPEHGIVVAVMTNTSFADTAAIGVKIAEPFAAQGKNPAPK